MVTSISPKNLDNQREAIDTWVRAGFEIISCNIKLEIEQIKDKFQNIKFVEVTRDGSEVMGKPCPYIYDMLQILKQNADEICGIVNSDIYLHKFDNEAFECIQKQARDKLLFMRRNDINTLQDINNLNCELFFGGIDVFIFSKRYIDIIEDDGLLIGQAMWDYWFPIIFSMHNIGIKEIVNPYIFHIRHAVQWSDLVTKNIASRICQKYFDNIKSEDSVSYLKTLFFNIISKSDIGVCIATNKVKQIKVLVEYPRQYEKEIKEQLKCQTHKNTYMIKNIKWDYLINIPYKYQFSNCFIDLCLWICNEYKISSMQIMIYIRRKAKNEFDIQNCCMVAVKRFNKLIPLISISKFGCKKITIDNLTICSSCVSSIKIEDDTEIIWKRQGISGKVLIYPAGYMAQEWVKRYKKVAEDMIIIGYMDKNLHYENKLLNELPVYPPEMIESLNFDKVIVISNLYQQEIYEEIMKKVPKRKIVIWDEFNINNIIE